MNNKNVLYILIGVLIAILIGGIIYFFIHTGKLNNQIIEEKRKAKYWNDTLRETQTQLGFMYEKYAVETRLKDETISQLTASLSLAMHFNSQVPVIVNTGEDSLFALHTPTYSDSGASIFLSDSVWFIKENKKWKSEQRADVTVALSLKQTVGRDSTGNFYGQVETNSKYVLITALNTFVNDLYNPPKTPTLTTEHHRTFGVCFDADSRSVAGGLMLDLGNYQVSTKYVIFSQGLESNAKFYERLRLGLGYYIF